MKIKIPSKYKKILYPIRNTEYYFAGGFVRDLIINRTPKDIDIITYSGIKSLERLFKKKAYLVNERFNTARFYIDNIFIDVNIIDKNLYNDALRRDFTINSLIADKNGNIFDYFNSIKDIENKTIRPVNKQSLEEDPLRILRAIRFKKSFNFNFAKGLKTQIINKSYLLNKVPAERVYTELQGIFNNNNSGEIFRELYRLNVLQILIPEIKQTEKFAHRKYKAKYLINHLFTTAEAIDYVLQFTRSKRIKNYYNENKMVLYFSALLHDIEKPSCEKKLKNKLSFAGHDIKSAETTKKILFRLRFSNKEIQKIYLLIKNHMRPHLLIDNDSVTKKGLYRLYRDLGNDLEGLILLSFADKYSSEGIISKQYITLYRKIINIKKQIEQKKINFITGKDILKYFNIKPGPIVGELIEKGNEYAVSHKITNKKIILKYLKQFIQ